MRSSQRTGTNDTSSIRPISAFAEDKYDAENAMNALNGSEIGGKQVKVIRTKEKERERALLPSPLLRQRPFRLKKQLTQLTAPFSNGLLAGAGHRWQGREQGGGCVARFLHDRVQSQVRPCAEMTTEGKRADGPEAASQVQIARKLYV